MDPWKKKSPDFGVKGDKIKDFCKRGENMDLTGQNSLNSPFFMMKIPNCRHYDFCDLLQNLVTSMGVDISVFTQGKMFNCFNILQIKMICHKNDRYKFFLEF